VCVVLSDKTGGMMENHLISGFAFDMIQRQRRHREERDRLGSGSDETTEKRIQISPETATRYTTAKVKITPYNFHVNIEAVLDG